MKVSDMLTLKSRKNRNHQSLYTIMGTKNLLIKFENYVNKKIYILDIFGQEFYIPINKCDNSK